MLLNCGIGEALEGPLDCKEIKPVKPEGNQSWIFIGRTDAEAETPILWPSEELTHWERPWFWERLKAGGERDDRGWDGCMTSLTGWTWVGASSKSWWWTGNPGVLQSMGSQRVGHDWVTELNWKKSSLMQILLEQNKKLIILIVWKLVLYIKKIFWKTN